MLNLQELRQLRELRVKLLHYWQKFPEEATDKKQLDEWQDLLDKIIIREANRIELVKGDTRE